MAYDRRVMARPSKRTPALTAALCDVLARGGSHAAACAAVSIHPSQMYRWCQRFARFREAIERAEAAAEDRYAKVIDDAAQRGEWRAAAFWLERRRPNLWRLREEPTVQVEIDVPALMRAHLVRQHDDPPALPAPPIGLEDDRLDAARRRDGTFPNIAEEEHEDGLRP